MVSEVEGDSSDGGRDINGDDMKGTNDGDGVGETNLDLYE